MAILKLALPACVVFWLTACDGSAESRQWQGAWFGKLQLNEIVCIPESGTFATLFQAAARRENGREITVNVKTENRRINVSLPAMQMEFSGNFRDDGEVILEYKNYRGYMQDGSSKALDALPNENVAEIEELMKEESFAILQIVARTLSLKLSTDETLDGKLEMVLTDLSHDGVRPVGANECRLEHLLNLVRRAEDQPEVLEASTPGTGLEMARALRAEYRALKTEAAEARRIVAEMRVSGAYSDSWVEGSKTVTRYFTGRYDEDMAVVKELDRRAAATRTKILALVEASIKEFAGKQDADSPQADQFVKDCTNIMLSIEPQSAQFTRNLDPSARLESFRKLAKNRSRIKAFCSGESENL